MNVFTTLEPCVKLPSTTDRPQEDYVRVSTRYPIFVVADGVTLEPDTQGKYPEPSGAAEAARLFAETVIEEAEHVYDQLSDDMLLRLFRAGNAAVAAHNKRHGRTRDSINYWDTDLFATTAAFGAVVKDRLYWFSIADAGISTIANGNHRKLSDTGWVQRLPLPEDWHSRPETERRTQIRSKFRNALDGGRPTGYGVATGEKAAEAYVQSGIAHLRPETRILLYSDGFEHHLNEPEFITLVDMWPSDFEDAVRALDKEFVRDLPLTFGMERSIIVVRQ